MFWGKIPGIMAKKSAANGCLQVLHCCLTILQLIPETVSSYRCHLWSVTFNIQPIFALQEHQQKLFYDVTVVGEV